MLTTIAWPVIWQHWCDCCHYLPFKSMTFVPCSVRLKTTGVPLLVSYRCVAIATIAGPLSWIPWYADYHCLTFKVLTLVFLLPLFGQRHWCTAEKHVFMLNQCSCCLSVIGLSLFFSPKVQRKITYFKQLSHPLAPQKIKSINGLKGQKCKNFWIFYFL